MKLSIIICVYNTAREYLDKCLSSITRGTLSRANYEICMVDDGSTVDYSDLIEKYNLKYKKTENRGILKARLLGIEMSEGEYIAFCDSDDSVTMNYHLPMLEYAEDRDADIVINDWAFHTERSRYACLADSTVSHDIELFGDDILLEFARQEGREHSFFVLWNKLYRAELLKKSAECIKRDTDSFAAYSYSEDALLNFYAFKYAKRLGNIHTGYYFYRIHDAQTVKVISSERLKSHIDCMAHTLRTMLCSLDENTHAEKIAEHIKSWQGLMSRTHYSYARAGGYTELYEYIKEKYSVNELKKSTLKDGRAYSKCRIIGSNIEEIDSTLIKIMNSDSVSYVDPKKLDPYARNTVEYLNNKWGRVKFSNKPDTHIERERISIKQKIVHNYLLYTMGTLLFPKGSRIRSFLKKVI